MESKEGRYPVNARVSVDYSKGKPDIKFGYPRKPTEKDVVRQNAGTGIFIYPLMILLCFGFFFFTASSTQTTDILYNCSVELNNSNSEIYNNTFFLNDLKLTCLDKEILIDYKNTIEISRIETYARYKKQAFIQVQDNSTLTLILLAIYALLIYASFFFIWFLDKFLARYYTKWKWYQKFQPRFQAWKQRTSKKRAYYAKFKKEDIKNNQIEIPLFKNVKLEYKTNGDFSDKLLKLEITEHDFLEKVRFKKKPDKKSMKQVWLWKTIFTFKDIPKDGYLEVWFK